MDVWNLKAMIQNFYKMILSETIYRFTIINYNIFSTIFKNPVLNIPRVI